ncbi:MAG: hypothetical protein WBA74_23545 [Cyclobacteriaceae bacterium]
MEFSNAMEDAMVLHYLQKMEDNALKKANSTTLDGNEKQWQEHLDVIKRAIENTREVNYPIKKTA